MGDPRRRSSVRGAFAVPILITLVLSACGNSAQRGELVPAPIRPATADPSDPDATEPPEGTPPPYLTRPIEGTRVVSFPASDETQLTGRFFGDDGDRNRGVLLLHSSKNDQRSWYPFAQKLQADGYAVVALDFRGYGQSKGTRVPAEYPKDVAGGLDLLELFGVTRIAVVGSEVGGTAAIGVSVVAARNVQGVVTLASKPTFQDLDVRDQARDWKEPALMLDHSDSSGELAKLVPEAEREQLPLLDLPERDAGVMARISTFIDKVI